MVYLETKSTNPYYNLAFEEFVLLNKDKDDYVIIWQNDNTIVVGQNQNTLAEINEQFVKENNINIVRRKTGGGAVYHDLGNINYSFISDAKDTENINFKHFTNMIVDALTSLGLNAYAGGRNDIYIDNKKISGTAQRIHKGRILFHGTLLFDSNLAMVSKSLNPDKEKFKGKSTKSVKSRVGNICDFLPNKMSTTEFIECLKDKLNIDKSSSLTKKELSLINQIKDVYESYEWNYAKSPQFEVSSKNKYDGGIIEATFSVKSGVIKELAFYGDFMSKRPLDPVIDSICGLKYEKKCIYEALEKIPCFEDFFGSISIDELCDLLF